MFVKGWIVKESKLVGSTNRVDGGVHAVCLLSMVYLLTYAEIFFMNRKIHIYHWGVVKHSFC